MKSHFEYELKTPIQVAVGGKEEEHSTVLIKAPRAKDKWEISDIECILHNGFIESNKNRASNDDDDDIVKKPRKKPETLSDEDREKKGLDFIELILLGSLNQKKVRTLYMLLSQLLCAGNQESPQAKIGPTKFTQPIYEYLEYEDMKELLVRYIYHFLSSKSRILRALLES